MAGSFLDDDIPSFFASSDFGEANAVYGGNTVKGIFDDEDVEVQMGEGVAEIIPQPMFTATASDFSSIAREQTLEVAGETFLIKNWKRDGTGLIEIFLKRTS